MKFLNLVVAVMALMFAGPLWATGEDVRGANSENGTARSEDGTGLESGGSQQLLIQAIESESIEAVQAELKKGVDVNGRHGHTFALFEAVQRRTYLGGTNLEIIKLLLAAGAETNRRVERAPNRTSNLDGFAPLHLAVRSNRYDIAKLLLQHGADPNFRACDCVLYENCDPKACGYNCDPKACGYGKNSGYSAMHLVTGGGLLHTDLGVNGDDGPMHMIAETIGELAVNFVWHESFWPPAKARRHIYKWMDLLVRYGGDIHAADPYGRRGGALGDAPMLLFRPMFYQRYRHMRQSEDRAQSTCRQMLNK